MPRPVGSLTAQYHNTSVTIGDGVAYVQLTGASVARTDEIPGTVLFDYDETDHLVGIELILGERGDDA